MLGRLLFEMGDYDGSIKEFDFVRKITQAKEAYANIGIANIQYEISTQIREDNAK